MNFNAHRTGWTLGYLEHALVEAFEAQWDGEFLWPDYLDICFVGADKQERWDRIDSTAQAFWLLEQVRASTAIVPGYICVLADVPCGSTYAKLAETLEMDLRSFENVSGKSEPGFTGDFQ
jgi:hypothetical protein